MSRRRKKDGTRTDGGYKTKKMEKRLVQVGDEDFSLRLEEYSVLSGPSREEALARAEMQARVDCGFASYMCLLHYCSPYFDHDPDEAARWALIGTENRDSWSADWLLYLLSREGSAPHAPFDGDLHMRPGFRVLLLMTNLGDMGGIDWISKGWQNVYENDVFSCTSDGDEGSFVFHPTGFETEWGLSSPGSSEDDPSDEEIDRMLDACIDSLVAQYARDAPESAHGISPEMRDRLVRALDLPLEGEYMGCSILGSAVALRLEIAFGEDDGYVLEASMDEGVSVDGRPVQATETDIERLLYAACFAPSSSGLAYGYGSEGSPEWRLSITGARRTNTYKGAVLPPFMDALAMAMERCADPSMKECRDALGFFDSIPVPGSSVKNGPTFLATIKRDSTVRERALTGYSGIQEIVVEQEEKSVLFEFDNRDGFSGYTGMDIEPDGCSANDLLRLFDDIHEQSCDPACPWSAMMECEGSPSSVRISGPMVRGILTAILDGLGGRDTVVERITGILDEDDPRRPLFDDADWDYPDYYGLKK